jgi:hypothetical protein
MSMFVLCQKRAFCSSVLVPAIVAWTWAAREKRFGFPDVGAIVAGRDQIFPYAAKPDMLNDWRNICRAGFPMHQALPILSFLGDVGLRLE